MSFWAEDQRLHSVTTMYEVAMAAAGYEIKDRAACYGVALRATTMLLANSCPNT